ncbi:MAG TPA: 4a-hydroxytetrahydrobiopterin dehydratase [Anaerolineae bacterium]|nr:4a-hydroxytetrahydrobiopterin dehydratase [Anaerolineae bacterium]
MSKRTLLTESEIASLLDALPGWEVQEGTKLYKEFKFDSFAGAMGWMMQMAIEADKLDHHPNWTNVYNRVEVELWTHSAGGLTGLDRELGIKMEEAFG